MQGTDGQAWKSYFTRVIALHKAFLFKKKKNQRQIFTFNMVEFELNVWLGQQFQHQHAKNHT